MKSIIKKAASILLTLSMAVGLCACGSGEKEVVVSDGEEIVIRTSWWGNDKRHTYTLDGLDLFMSENPSIKVKASYGIWEGYSDRQSIYMKSNDEPDVMLINYSWLEEYSSDGKGFYNLYELTDEIDLSGFTEEELAYGVVDGKLNAVPVALNTQVFYFNKTIFDSYGLEVPKTWDQLFAAAEVMRNDGVYPLGTSSKFLFLMLLSYRTQITGKSFISEDGKILLEYDDVCSMLDFYKRMIDSGVLMPVDDFDRNEFILGNVAGTLQWLSDADSYCDSLDASGAEIVVGDYLSTSPYYTGKLGNYIKPATLYAIGAHSAHPKEAAKLLNFLVNNKEMALLQGNDKGVPLSDAAYVSLANNGRMEGHQYEGFLKLENTKDRMEIMQPVLEDPGVYDTFKEQADYYIYDIDTMYDVAELIIAMFIQYK